MHIPSFEVAIIVPSVILLAGIAAWALPPDDPLAAIVEQLKSPEANTRDEAATALKKLSSDGLTPEQAMRCLREAAQPFPPRLGEFHDGCSDLVEAAATRADAGMAAIIEPEFAKYSDAGKTQALALLLGLDDESAAQAVLRVLALHSKEGTVPDFPYYALLKKPHHLDILFPALLDYAADPRLTHDVCYACWKLVSDGKLPGAVAAAKGDRILAAEQRIRKSLAASWHDKGLSWRGGDQYRPVRETAGLLLDLLGYVDSAESREELRASLDFADPFPRCYAVVSLLRLGEEVGPVPLRAVAACDETRNTLFSVLEKLGRGDLFPKEQRTQEAFARSNMVQWLTYPTELGCPPDEIELMKTVSVEAADGRIQFYLFRFRTFTPHWAAKDGWEAGWSGGYAPFGDPTTSSSGGTFSCFHPWDADVAEADLRKFLAQRARRNEEK